MQALSGHSQPFPGAIPGNSWLCRGLFPGFPYQGPLQIEGLGVLAQQHHVLLQVVKAPVLVVPDPLLGAGKGVRGGAQGADSSGS